MPSFDLEAAHKACKDNRQEMLPDVMCGCFYCQSTFKAGEITTWINGDQMALCPNCGIDSVISESSGYPIADRDFLSAMHQRWFGTAKTMTRKDLHKYVEKGKIS